MSKFNYYQVIWIFSAFLVVIQSCKGIKEIEENRFKLSKLFQHHMILQRDKPCKVWGWGNPGEAVKISIGNEEYQTEISNNGKWGLEMDSHPAGGPHSLIVSTADTVIKMKDIYYGDVWLCSGQSNMDSQVNRFKYTEQELGVVDDSLIRLFDIPDLSSFNEENEILGECEWVSASSESIGEFSAVGFFFARQLRQSQHIPIGLISASWGGSRIESWMSQSTLGIKDLSVFHKEKLIEDSINLVGKLNMKRSDFETIDLVDDDWFSDQYDDSSWNSHHVLRRWEDSGYEYLDGVLYYRSVFSLDKIETDSATLSLGRIDDSDETWLNGEKIGGMTGAPLIPRKYRFSSGLLKKGKNVIVVKIEDLGISGGFRGPYNGVYLSLGDMDLDLSANWKFKVGRFDFEKGGDQDYASLLYNAMISPVKNYGIKGVAWYQGENNALTFEEAYQYRDLFPSMIQNWRDIWKQPDLPIIYVQLTSYFGRSLEPNESKWGLMRESQDLSLKLKNVGQVVTIDIGNADDIHPRNKQDVGKRLAMSARKIAYGEDLVYASPRFQSIALLGKKAVVTFNHVGDGLKSKNEFLKGFAIAGKDKKFVWAKASIKNKNQVEIWSNDVNAIEAVRYAWSDNPGYLSLYNSANLPASPFRTDDWNEWPSF